jgi:hypothetical protein
MTPYNRVEVHRGFGGTYYLHLQGIMKSKKQAANLAYCLALKIDSMTLRNVGEFIPDVFLS